MKKILVTGSNGLLGQKIVYNLLDRGNFEIIATARGENRLKEKNGYEFVSLDITDENAISDVFEKHQPNVVINTAAMTNVDQCESEKEACWELNVIAVKYLAQASEKHNSHLIHLSTDFVFDGEDGPYTEGDEPNPLHYYAESKLASERILQDYNIKWSIARTIIIYGIVDDMSRSNLVLWAKSSIENKQTINVVNDQYRSPTLAEDLAEGCILIAEKEAEGIFHLSGPETHCILDLVYMVADYYDLDKSYIKPITSVSLNQAAKRPPKTGFIIDKAKEVLGYNPVGFREGIKILEDQIKEKEK
ncbi:MAG: SDR family oxidoreductase [Flavobacteriales bacterium]|nr:SDR family oxidoreductase [Flavobacteriales bacterium]